jgi:hypothetical protein
MSRARQYTKAEALAECERLNRQNGVLSLALSLSTSGSPDATEVAYSDRYRYVFKLYGARRADGGIVTMTFHAPDERPITSAYYLEDLASTYRGCSLTDEMTSLRNAVDKLYVKRNRLVDIHSLAKAC